MTAVTLRQQLSEVATSLYNDPSYMTFIDDHVEQLRRDPQTATTVPEPAALLKYQCDFYGLLGHLQVPSYLHYTVMKINGITSPTTVQEADMSKILIPDVNRIKMLFNLWKAHHKTRK